MNFNPRTPVGCDLFGQGRLPVILFQSTHPSGVRPGHATIPSTRCYFNPRTPVGCDCMMLKRSDDMAQFQSTHPSGVRRQTVGRLGFVHGISIHAPQWGATISPAWSTRLCTAFQSTHPSGVRPAYAPRLRSVSRDFNPRTPVGCDSSGSRRRVRQMNFNPRTPVGCDRSLM